jgi:hypothetical protein
MTAGTNGGRGPKGDGPPLEIVRKLRMLAIPALMVLAVGVSLLAVYYSTGKADRSEAMFYFATALTFGSLLVLFPVAKVFLLWPKDSGRVKTGRKGA